MAISDHIKPTPPRILVAGCGKLGGAVAQALAADAQVYGLRRSPAKVPEGIHAIGADLRQPEQLTGRLPTNLDVVIYCLTPAQYDDQGYQDAYVTGLANLLDALDRSSIKRLVFVSSTSVYHQDDDSWVNEDSPTEPRRFSGQAILSGEQLALASGIPATVVRFSGIYGPSRRRFLEAVRQGGMNPTSPGPYSNRIHEDDAAGVLVHLTRMALEGQPLEERYIASDCEPVRLDEVVAWVQEQTPCAPPAPDALAGGRAGSKRCDNTRLLTTGYRFQFPDFRAGYGPMIGS